MKEVFFLLQDLQNLRHSRALPLLTFSRLVWHHMLSQSGTNTLLASVQAKLDIIMEDSWFKSLAICPPAAGKSLPSA